MTAAAIPPVPMALFDTRFESFAETLVGSFRRYGFAVIGDHGIDADVIEAATWETKAFFALSDETKRRFHIPGQGGARGYTPFGIETAKGATH
ncbi:MAG: 2-oxoglutarate and iron-dependent oxygenase domain-containing protein, partial [Asticcacaulis sp.]